MISKIDLCSYALLKIGEQPIQSLTDQTAAAQLSRTLFDPVADAMIACHPWRFATKELDLVKNTDGDFLIPGDVLRVIKCPGQIVGNKIISIEDSISITAIVRTPVENYPSYFVALVAAKLAMEFCIPLLGDQNTFRMLVALYEAELRTAKFIDGTTSAPFGISNFSLINARF